MPNTPPQPPQQRPIPPRSPSKTIGSIVRGFKIGVTKWMRANTVIRDVWQRNYYEHVIRDDESLAGIRRYIATNPQQWDLDRENPACLPVAASAGEKVPGAGWG